MWVHTKLNSVQLLQREWRLSQHLFGWHLLPRSPYLHVDLVEAEKTAVVCSAVFPKCLWLATGGLSQFNNRLNALHGSKVVAFPDLGGFDKWVVKVEIIRRSTLPYPITWRVLLRTRCGRWERIWQIGWWN